MKRTILIIAALFSFVALFAQNKGDKYISAAASLSFGSQNTRTTVQSITKTQKSPLTTEIDLIGEFGYFITDNVRLGLALDFPITSSPSSKENGKWLRNNTVGLSFNPNVAYYYKLTEGLYYTPEAGVSFGFGSYKQEISSDSSYSNGYTNWGINVTPLALEYQVNPKIALGIGVFSFGYNELKIKNKSSDTSVAYGQFKFDFNSAFISVRFYL